MLRRVDSRARLALAVPATFLGGWGLLYAGVSAGHSDVPASVCAIPPAMFAAVVLVFLIANARQVAAARRLLTDGEAIAPGELRWLVFPHTDNDPRDDIRTSCLPESGWQRDTVQLELDRLDDYRDWYPRQSRTILVQPTSDALAFGIRIPSAISAAQVKRGSVLRMPGTSQWEQHGYVIPDVGLFLPRVDLTVHQRRRAG